jgi:aminoglycoside phosphotransferase (APT) family kinase protein
MQRDCQISRSVRKGSYVAPPRSSSLPRPYLTTSQAYEAKGFEFLGKLSTNSKAASVRVPHLLAFDKNNHVLIMEDVGNNPSLKSWLTADSLRDQVASVGRSLGSYLAHVHNTTANDSAIKEAFSSNTIGKNVSSSVYYTGLPTAARKFGYTQPFITAAAKFAENEVLTANEVWTLGDFWTGNVLVSGPSEHNDPKLTVLDLELAKPGTAAFDIGQMGAEMLCLARFRSEDQGSLLLRTFFQAYKAERKAEVDAAAVAIRM